MRYGRKDRFPHGPRFPGRVTVRGINEEGATQAPRGGGFFQTLKRIFILLFSGLPALEDTLGPPKERPPSLQVSFCRAFLISCRLYMDLSTCYLVTSLPRNRVPKQPGTSHLVLPKLVQTTSLPSTRRGLAAQRRCGTQLDRSHCGEPQLECCGFYFQKSYPVSGQPVFSFKIYLYYKAEGRESDSFLDMEPRIREPLHPLGQGFRSKLMRTQSSPILL